MAIIGKPLDRIDGRLKVTGGAKYSAEFNQPGMVYAVPIGATVAKGKVVQIDGLEAQSSPGFLALLTHENAPRLKVPNFDELRKFIAIPHESAIPFQDNTLHYFGQFVACVVAETYEQARYAARLVRITYAAEKPAIDLKAELPNGFRPEKIIQQHDAQINAGQAAGPLAASPIKIEQTYTTPTEVHNALESHSGIVLWEGADKMTVYEATQGTVNTSVIISYFFDLPRENVRVICRYLGGGFGSKGAILHYLITAMAARIVKRPVKMYLTRQMMQLNTGRRGETIQTIALGAQTNGKLSVIRHHTDTYANPVSQYFESCGLPTEVLYDAPLREITYRVAKLNVGAPRFMRAPGETPGSFAMESAMDELAFELNIDPIELRRLNHTAIDPMKKIPFSGEHLLECYKTGAEKFGWANRDMKPRQKRNGRYLIGYGMATATYPGYRSKASVRVKMMADGSVTVMCGTQDLGTGTYTICAQTAADALGIPMDKIVVEIGDSNLPPGNNSVGSQTTASVHPAILETCEKLREDLMQLAINDPKSKLKGRQLDEIEYADEKFFLRSDSSKLDSYVAILRRNRKTQIEACVTTLPVSGNGLTIPGAPCEPANIPEEENSDNKKYSFHSFGAQFAEVWVDEALGRVDPVSAKNRSWTGEESRISLTASCVFFMTIQ
ncbi:MAG: xanthine dehydrogenase family protein molybdopterin-binding subunit, partial [Chitinophagaceae bacterium]|nr:xanthine dehydrogenase family protein molybdopterin-binding subunit [Chitinophagaceae bacterium]